MAIEVEGPDGSVVEFPDGTSNDVIKGAMAKHFGSPTKTQASTPEQKTEKLGAIEKGARATAYGLLGGAEGAMNSLGKAIGADPQKLAKVNMLINAGREAMGVTPEEYAPATVAAANPKASFGERMSYMPRALIESGAPIAVGAALGGLPGAIGTVGFTEAGPTIDRVREADKTDPNAELTPEQKARVAGKVGLDMLLAGVGGKATFGATQPIRDVGMAGVKQAVGNVAKAAGIDTAVGGGTAAADKLLVDKEAPSFNDVAVPALTGSILGAAVHAPGSVKETAVSIRNRALGDLDPQSRGTVADVLSNYKGDFTATQKHLEHELKQSTKGLDEVTKDQIAKAKIKYDAGQRVDPETIRAISEVDPAAGAALTNLDTFGVMKALDNGGVSNSFIGRVLNPFERTRNETSGDRFASALGRAAEYASIGHSMWSHSPETALGVFGTQLAGTGLLHGIDRLTGAANPGKVIVDKFAGTAEPMPSVAEARASEDAARAKAEKKVQEAEAKVKEAQKDADPNMYVFEHRGQKTRVDKSLVTSPKRYAEAFKRLTDRRVDLLDEAKALTDDTKTHKYLDQLAKDWTDATNDPTQARRALDRILNDKSVPEDVKKHLEDNWYRVVGTWETVERNND